jgi:hypothetical protein
MRTHSMIVTDGGIHNPENIRNCKPETTEAYYLNVVL